MTIEIFYLTEQIHRWLNAQVARHLAIQAERLMTAHQIAPRTLGTGEVEGIAIVDGAEMAAMPWKSAAGSRCPAAQIGRLDSENEAVRA